MGLDTSHDCWHGAYSAFNRWRIEVCRAAGLPPLELMEGFFYLEKAVLGNPFWRSYEEDKKGGYVHEASVWQRLPIRWDCLRPSPLHILLHHSDCEGELLWKDCGPIADELEKLLPTLSKLKDDVGHIGNWQQKTKTFIAGLRRAAKAKENVEFH